jgi:succinyl-CoA synthetase beta subunit
MNLHEYQAKELFREYGVAVPQGRVAASPDEAGEATATLGAGPWVVKAQVHAGGRGKAGGVKLCRTVAEVRSATAGLLGQRLVTRQTDAAGLAVHQVYVEAGSAIERELYLSLLLNRDRSRLAFIASAAGGMDIEEVAARTPEKILRVEIHPAAGLQGFHCRRLAFGLGLAGPQVAQFEQIARGI